MTKEKYLQLAESRYEEMKKLTELDNFYDYEKSFDELWQDFGRSCMEALLQKQGSISNDRRKKKR